MDKLKTLEIPAEKTLELEECVFGMYEYGCAGHVLANTQRLLKELMECVEAQALQAELKRVIEKCEATYGTGTCAHAQHNLRMGDVKQTLVEIAP